MNFFTPNDCDGKREAQYPGNVGPYYNWISLEHANALLKERGTVVYSDTTNRLYTTHKCRPDTHRALVINIEPIDVPDSEAKVLKDFVDLFVLDGNVVSFTLTPDKVKSIVERAKALLAKKET